MELYIRSQDKEKLKKSNDIIEIRFIKNYIGYGDGWAIFINKTIMGSYISRKRALEVLDEIQKLLEPKFTLHTEEIEHPITEYMCTIEQIGDIKELSTRVYEMPKE